LDIIACFISNHKCNICICILCPTHTKCIILSRVRVMREGAWIGNRIYCTLLLLVTTLHRSLTHTVSSGTLLGSDFQRRTFLCFRAHILAGWRPSHANLILWPLASAGTSINS
jgi:hypothetical protein